MSVTKLQKGDYGGTHSGGSGAGEKIVLPANRMAWSLLDKHWAAERPTRWRNLAMLELYEVCGWEMTQVAVVFGMHKGQVSRILQQTRQELNERFKRGQREDVDVEDCDQG